MIHAITPKKAHMVASEVIFGVIASMVIGVAGSTPPTRATTEKIMKANAIKIIRVAPIEVTEPIHLAPLVETQVAKAKMMIDTTVIAVWDIIISLPKNA